MPGEPVVVQVRVGPHVHADHVTCYYTTDSSEPSGAHGLAKCGQTVELARTGIVWDTLAVGLPRDLGRQYPAAPGGTLVRYRIEAWSERRAESDWASEIAGVVSGERPPGVPRSTPSCSLRRGRRSGQCAAAAATPTTWTRSACRSGCTTQ